MEILKNRNRTLLEVNTGILVLTILVIGLGLLLPVEHLGLTKYHWCGGIGLAAALDVLSFWHMYRCLDRALDYDEENASKMIFTGYLTRYLVFGLVLIVASVSGIVNPLLLCLGYLLMMKIAAYLQPYTHKFYNWIFHETDPVARPVEEIKEEEEKGR